MQPCPRSAAAPHAVSRSCRHLHYAEKQEHVAPPPLCYRTPHRFQELQTAHMELGRAMSDPNNSVNKLAKYRVTVKTQEEVRARM